MTPQQAAEQLERLFPDGGKGLLEEGGLTGGWDQVVLTVPAPLFQPAKNGFDALTVLRNHWSQRNLLRPAIAATRGLLRRRIESHGREHADTLLEVGALGALAQRAGRQSEAHDMLTEAFEGLRPLGGKDLRFAVVAGNYALYWLSRDEPAKALDALEQAYRVRTRVAPETTGLVAAQIGELLVRLERIEEAVPYLREGWERHLRQLGPAHPKTVARAHTLGNVLNRLERYRESAPVLRDVHAAVTKSGPPERVAAVGFELGVALHNSFYREEGLRLIEESIRWTRSAGTIDEPHASLPTRLTTWAHLQLERRRPAEFEGLMREALEAERKLFGDASAEVAGRYAALGYFCAQTGRIHEALGWLDPAASILRSTLGDAHRKTKKVVAYQVGLLQEQARVAIDARDRQLAMRLLSHAKSLGTAVLGPGSREMADLRRLEEQIGRGR